ncbi:hypothetical protein Trydic_g8060 [Trypoxylus dichotomus]
MTALNCMDNGILFNGHRMNNIWFADDTIVFVESLKDLQALTDKIIHDSSRWNLEVNENPKNLLDGKSDIRRIPRSHHAKRGKIRFGTSNPTMKSLWTKRARNTQDIVAEKSPDLVQQNILTTFPDSCRQGPNRYDDRQHSQRTVTIMLFSRSGS